MPPRRSRAHPRPPGDEANRTPRGFNELSFYRGKCPSSEEPHQNPSNPSKPICSIDFRGFNELCSTRSSSQVDGMWRASGLRFDGVPHCCASLHRLGPPVVPFYSLLKKLRPEKRNRVPTSSILSNLEDLVNLSVFGGQG